MLRISTANNEQETRFKLEGKLAHEWVAEAAFIQSEEIWIRTY